MNNIERHFKNVTLLITHYNRSNSLARLLNAFRELNCYFGDIVVSDDGSSDEHLEVLRKLQESYYFKLKTTPVNKGLGHNINKGQEAVGTPYTLYIQEDFIPKESFAKHFEIALNFMVESDWDIIRFYAYIKYPYLKSYRNGFSEMIFKRWFGDFNKIYQYSDHPHLRKSSFFEKFGRYKENLKGDKTEYLMCLSFIKNKGRGLFYDDFKGLFTQENSNLEPSTMSRNSILQSDNIVIAFIRYLYRQIKYNYDLNF